MQADVNRQVLSEKIQEHVIIASQTCSTNSSGTRDTPMSHAMFDKEQMRLPLGCLYSTAVQRLGDGLWDMKNPEKRQFSAFPFLVLHASHILQY